MVAGLHLSPHQACHQLVDAFVKAVRLDPQFHVPRQDRFKRTLLKNHAEKLSAAVIQEVSLYIAISLTFDIWTSRNRSFIGIAAHGITKNFGKSHRLIGFTEFNEQHTGDNIVDKIKGCLEDVAIDLENVVALTHDSASNNSSKKSLEATPTQIRILCAAHKTSNACNKFVKQCSEVQEATCILKRLSRLFRKSTVAARVLRACQESIRVALAVLPAVSTTRFNGGYLLMKSILPQQAAITLALTKLQLNHPVTFKLMKLLPTSNTCVTV